MGMGGGGKTVQTTTQELAPEQRELLKGVIPIAQDYLKNPPKQYPGTGIVDWDPMQKLAQQMTLNAAGNVTGYNNTALQGIMGGAKSLNWTGKQANQAWQDIMPTLNKTGKGMMQDASGVADTLNWAGRYGKNAAEIEGNNIRNMMQRGNAATAPGLEFLTGGAVLDPNQNSALRAATESAMRPAIDNFRNVILPSIGNEAITAGGYGGTRQQIAEGLAAQGLQRTTGDIAANMYSNAYGQGLNAMTQGLNTQVNQTGQNLQAMVSRGQLTQQAARQLMDANLGGGQLTQQAAAQMLQAQLGGFGAQNAFMQTKQQGIGGALNAYGMVPGLSQDQLLPAQLVASVGEQRQAFEQAKLTEQIQKYVNNQLIPFSTAQDVASLAFGVPGGSTTGTSNSSGGSSFMPWLQAGVGMASALPALFGLFGSDRRLKENIEQIGILSDGLPVYRFNYIGSGKTYAGLMADEVGKLYPEAIGEIAGFAAIHYDRIQTWKDAINV